MYIWILLATIMVALSFFNLSPRSDKDNVFSEIKAATIINRFRIENNAVVRLLQCEVLSKGHSNNWDGGGTTGAGIQVSLTDNDGAPNPTLNFGYTSPTDNLPVGYDLDNDFKVYHYVYCLDRKAEESGAVIMNPCQYGSSVHPTYVISFAKIPMRYLVKNSGHVTSDEEGNVTYDSVSSGVIEPLPMFLKYLADETRGTGIAGWTDCTAVGTCLLKGANAYKSTGVMDDNNNLALGTEHSVLPINSVLYNSATFSTVCGTSQPCMFIYRKMPTTDEHAYCRKRLTGWVNRPPEEEEPEGGGVLPEFPGGHGHVIDPLPFEPAPFPGHNLIEP